MPLESLLDCVVRMLIDRKNPKGVIQRLFRLCRLLASLAACGYLLLMVGILFCLEFYAEWSWFLWLFLYLPPYVLLLPIAGLTPICLLFRPKLILLQVAAVVILVGVYMDPQFNFASEKVSGSIRVLSNNIGQKGERLTPFVEQTDPDIIALQEAPRRGPGYAKQYSDRNVAYHGEFILISRFPILESKIIETVRGRYGPVAARFLLDVNGRRVVFYNVHLASPRRELGRLWGRGLLKEILREYGLLKQHRNGSISSHLRRRIEVSRKLVDHIAAESDPVIVAGDMNTPNHGYIYHLLCSTGTSAFDSAGFGFGYTFPGYTRNPATFFRPWLQLDHIFVNEDWQVQLAFVEPERRSQHLAIVADLLLNN